MMVFSRCIQEAISLHDGAVCGCRRLRPDVAMGVEENLACKVEGRRAFRRRDHLGDRYIGQQCAAQEGPTPALGLVWPGFPLCPPYHSRHWA